MLVILLLAVAAVAALLITQRGRLGAGPSGGHEYVADIDNWQRTEREHVVTSPYRLDLAGNLQQVPLTLGDWSGIDVPQTNLEVFILLEPEQYVQRLYKRPDGRYVWLSLIGSRKSKSFHSPQICYDTDGWRTDASSEIVQLSQGEIYTLKLVATKSFPEGGTAEHVVLYLFLWPSHERSPQDGMVLVKVTAPIYDTVEESIKLEKEFLRLLFTGARR
jgi:hypothetical protein